MFCATHFCKRHLSEPRAHSLIYPFSFTHQVAPYSTAFKKIMHIFCKQKKKKIWNITFKTRLGLILRNLNELKNMQ
jgi:hypothetical protein